MLRPTFQRAFARSIALAASSLVFFLNVAAQQNAEEVFSFCGEDNDECLLQGYSEVIRLHPKDYETLLKRGDVYFKKDDCDNALLDYNKALELNPKSAEVYYGLGYIFYYQNDDVSAIRNFSQAVALERGFTSAYIGLGTSYDRIKNYEQSNKAFDEAIRQYTVAIELKPDLSDNHIQRGIAYSYKGKSDLEIADYNKAIELNPKNEEAYKYLGLNYFNKIDYQQAIYFYTKAIELEPEYAVAFDLRAQAYDQTGDKTRAAADRAKVRELFVKP